MPDNNSDGISKGTARYGSTVMNSFEEGKHPRADDGKFGSGSGSSGGSKRTKKAEPYHGKHKGVEFSVTEEGGGYTFKAPGTTSGRIFKTEGDAITAAKASIK